MQPLEMDIPVITHIICKQSAIKSLEKNKTMDNPLRNETFQKFVETGRETKISLIGKTKMKPDIVPEKDGVFSDKVYWVWNLYTLHKNPNTVDEAVKTAMVKYLVLNSCNNRFYCVPSSHCFAILPPVLQSTSWHILPD